MKEAQKDVKVLGKLDGGVPSENVCAVSVTKKNIFLKEKKIIYLFIFFLKMQIVAAPSPAANAHPKAQTRSRPLPDSAEASSTKGA